jgi:putative methionine-R-sulfoxide reductase with GAF domain/alkylhydroperoxidase family enzyme
MAAGKEALYRDLATELRALIDGEIGLIGNAANAAALIYHRLPDVNWAGFYLRKGSDLVLGPFQGKPACTRIPIGAGVCGTAASCREPVLVADVHDFPGHIACDPDSRSELAVPLIRGGEVVGVLDLDSPLAARFDDSDRRGCEKLVALLLGDRSPLPSGYPPDVDPASGCRLPLPRREELDAHGRETYDRLADPSGGTLRGLKGPGGIMLHSPELSCRARPLNHYLRHEVGLGGRVRELAILATARELDSQFEWAAHEPEALAEGISPAIIDIVRFRQSAQALDEADAVVVELAREIFGDRRVTPATYGRALRLFGRRPLVDLVALMGNYAATAALLTAFDMQLDPGQLPGLPHR